MCWSLVCIHWRKRIQLIESIKLNESTFGNHVIIIKALWWFYFLCFFLLVSAPRPVSFPVSANGLRSIQVEALVDDCSEWAQSQDTLKNVVFLPLTTKMFNRLLLPRQVTTLVTSAFLVVKVVIISHVSWLFFFFFFFTHHALCGAWSCILTSALLPLICLLPDSTLH